MGIRSTLSSILSAPLAAAVESRVRQVAAEVIDQADLADPAAVRELLGKVEQARRAVDGLAGDLHAVRDAVVAMADDDDDDSAGDAILARVGALSDGDQALHDQLTQAQARLAEVSAEVVALRKALATTQSTVDSATALAKAATTAAPKAAPAPPAPVVAESAPSPAPAASTDKGCKVDGCDGTHRARGFCGKHYQMWKRSTLPGFVDADGTVFEDAEGPRYTVDVGLSGLPAQIRRGKVHVDGKVVAATRQES